MPEIAPAVSSNAPIATASAAPSEERWRTIARTAFPFLVLALIWECAAHLGIFPPKLFPPLEAVASAFAHLGRDAEAREAAARLFEVDPSFTISAWIARGGQSNAKLMIEGLRKAGLPE